MQSELDTLISRLETIKIVDGHEDYNYLVSSADRYRDRPRIFNLLRSNDNALDTVVPLVFTFVSKLDAETDEQLFLRVVDFIRGCRDVKQETSEWIIKILFVVVEKTKDRRRNSETRLKLLECLKTHGESVGIINHLINLMYAKNSGEVVASILDFIPTISDEFVRSSMKQNNVVVLRNLVGILTHLSEKQIHLFVNYQHFDEFLDSEHFFMRNCFLEICMNLAEHFKECGKMEELNDIVSMVVERLSDVYFLVRYKALQVLDTFFERNSIVLEKRSEIAREIGGRVLDKAVIVRKKAISICSSLLMNNPFVSERTLEKKTINAEDRERDGDYCGERRRYFEDLNQFHDAMKEIQDNILLLMSGDSGTEVNECAEFVKLSFYYKITGSKKAFESLFDLVWTQEVEALMTSFRDLLVHVKTDSSSLFEFLREFVREEGNASFERILRELSGRRYMDKSFVTSLEDMFFQGASLFEASYLLLHIGRPLSVDTFHQMLVSSTQVLFSSTNETELVRGLKIYKNVIQMRVRERIEFDSETIELLIKNLVKMTFFEYQVVDLTVAAIYAISKIPERDSVALLEKLCSRNENSLKLVSAVGCIGLRHMQYLEELEKLVRANKATISIDKSVVTSDIKERRRSINASRQSLGRMADEDDTDAAGSRGPFDGEDVSSKLIDKSEEDIADFFFYVKEKEMLYGDSILSMFKGMVEEMCMSADEDVQVVAYGSLYKLMCISLEFFTDHYGIFIQSLKHPNHRIRANAVVAMSDFLLSYNTAVEGHVHLLFEALDDQAIGVKKNALLVIYNLVFRNILKIKGHGSPLSSLLMDEDEEMREIAKSLLRHISGKESIMATVFYETITTKNTDLTSIINFLTELISEKTREGLFVKALRSRVDPNTLRCIHQAFGLENRFMEELSHLEGGGSVDR